MARCHGGSAPCRYPRQRIFSIAAITPQIGIFWRIQPSEAAPLFLVDCIPASAAEPYGEFLTHGGHYKFWSRLGRMNAVELWQQGLPDIAKWSEYEEWPRGRVVFHMPRQRFVVYADRKLHTASSVDLIQRHFGLAAESFDLRYDPHYVSVR